MGTASQGLVTAPRPDTEWGVSEGPGLLGAPTVEIFGPCSGHCCSLPELQGTEPCLAPRPSCPPPGHLVGQREVLLGTEVAKKQYEN